MDSRKVGRPRKIVSRIKEIFTGSNNGNKTHTKKEKPNPIIVHSDAGTDYESWVLSANIDQSNEKFYIDSANRQSIAISCTAACFMESSPTIFRIIKHVNLRNQLVFNWSVNDLNLILEIGDHLYRISKNQYPNSGNILTFDEVFPYVQIENDIYHFAQNFKINNVNERICTLPNLIESIEYFYVSGVTKAIFICREFSMCIMFSNGKLVFFDSHKRQFDGYPVNEYMPNGAAILCIHKTIFGLARHLMINCNYNLRMGWSSFSTSVQFSLIAIETKKLSSTKIKAQYQKIKRTWESTEKKQTRLSDQRKRDEIRSFSDTNTDKQRRVHVVEQLRKLETPEQSQKRLDKQAKRSQSYRNSQTPEQASKRLRDKAKRSQKSRDTETTLQTSQRLEDMRNRKKIRNEISILQSREKHKNSEFISIRNIFSTKTSISDYIKRVLPDSNHFDLDVEKLVRKIFYHYNTVLNNFCKFFLMLKEKMLSMKLKADTMADLETKFVALFGQSWHTKSTEAYFAVSSYVINPQNACLICDDSGKMIHSCKNNNNNNSWICNEHCNLEKSIACERCYWIAYVFIKLKPEEIQAYFDKIDNCSNYENRNNWNVLIKRKCQCGEDKCIHSMFENQRIERLGHPEICYETTNSCESILLFFRRMSPHFPLMRQIVKLIYTIRKELTKLRFLIKVLEDGDLNQLKNASDQIQLKIHTFTVNAFPFSEECEIYDFFASGFRALRKKEIDWPVHICLSCRKLCPKSDMHKIENILYRKSYFKKLIQDFYNCEQNDENWLNAEDLCTYCYRKLMNNEMPSTCLLNNLYFKPIPDEIKNLNEFEKILIQRAKSFQTLINMNPVIDGRNKRNPTESIKKIKGRIFHLPLPLENTLQKLPNATEAIIENQELFIVVRGIPNKTGRIWQSLVDVKKIYHALIWYKANNPFYREIELPIEENDFFININSNEITLEQEENQNNDFTDEKNEQTNFTQEKKMLTQKDVSDEYYEHMTIYPVIESRINADSTKIYQFLKIIDKNIDNSNVNLDLMCFPYLFCEGKNGQNENRPVKLQPSDFANLLVRSSDPRFRTNAQFLFYLLNQANLRQLNAGIFHKLNITRSTKDLNAKRFMEMIQNNQIESNLNTIFGRLRGSEQYWKKFRNDLNCMTSHYGPATFFLTLSPSEYDWDDLHECYCSIYNVEKKSRTLSSFIASDPVIASLFIEMKFKAMLKFLLSDSKPLGKIIHYAWRREYQSRGLQHFHLIIWVENAPIIGKSKPEEISEFISTYITCQIPNKENFPVLHHRVTKYQKHTHSSYCLRSNKNKCGRTIKVCRFGFGRKITEELKLHGVAESIYGRRKLKKTRLYDLPRNESEKNINDYNAAILLAWCGNMDIQFIGEHSATLTQYISKYTTKSEKSSINDFGQMLQNKSAASNLWSLAFRVLNNRECGALEAADTLLQLSLFGSDSNTVIRWVDVAIKRSRKVKSKAEMEKMAKMADIHGENQDIFCPNWVDVHYPKRPYELENMCLYDFLRWFDIINNKPKSNSIITYPYGEKFLRKRKNPYLINHYQYNVKKEPESYYHSLLLLFLPWKALEDLKRGLDTYENAFLDCSNELFYLMQYHEKLQYIKKARDELNDELNLLLAADEIENTNSCEEEMQEIIGFEQVLENELNDINTLVRNVNNTSLEDQIAQLNDDQKRVFNNVTDCVKSYCQDLDDVLNENNIKNAKQAPKKILRMFVSGVGGSGKSFLINVTRRYIFEELKKDVVVTAPTGIAALNVNGLTLHKLLQLPIEHEKKFKYTRLSDNKLAELRNNLKNCVLLIIDEISMVSNTMLAFINQRLCEIFDTFELNDGWFGRLNILLFGDLLQLEPVNGDLPFIDISQNIHHKNFNSLANINLWKNIFSYDELTKNVRQKKDPKYSQILSEIRLGLVTESTEQLLRSKEIQLNGTSPDECLNNLCDYICKLSNHHNICLFATRNQCAILNAAMLSKIKSQKIVLTAHDQIEARTKKQRDAAKIFLKKWSDEKKSSLTAGLEEQIEIKLGAKIILLRNIEISSGLVNGAVGIVKKIHRGSISHQPIEKLTILFDCGEREITPVKVAIVLPNNALVTRTQFPISLAYAITIHKSQGLTIKSCLIDIGTTIFSKGQCYVALSRLESLDGLYILNFNPRSIQANSSAIIEYNRLRSTYRPELGLIHVHSTANRLISDQNVYFRQILHSIFESTIQETSNDEKKKDQASIIYRFRGLKNDDLTSCYANASFQCLLNIECVVNSVLISRDSDLKRLVIAYNDSNTQEPLDLSVLRKKYFENFNAQQDSSEFLHYLLTDTEQSFLKNLFVFNRTITLKCNACQYENSRTENDVMLWLNIPTQQSKDVSSMKELFEINFKNDWNVLNDARCPNCNALGLNTKTFTHNFGQIIIFVLQLSQNGPKITNFRIRDIPRKDIDIENKKYVFSGAIFHHGETFSSGHYTAILRNGNNLIKANDINISNCRWPKNSKDIYVMFYLRAN